jgi:hypothetical protein
VTDAKKIRQRSADADPLRDSQRDAANQGTGNAKIHGQQSKTNCVSGGMGLLPKVCAKTLLNMPATIAVLVLAMVSAAKYSQITVRIIEENSITTNAFGGLTLKINDALCHAQSETVEVEARSLHLIVSCHWCFALAALQDCSDLAAVAAHKEINHGSRQNTVRRRRNQSAQ